MRIVEGIEQGRALLTRQPGGVDPQVAETARAIIADVRTRGDAAVRDHTLRLDGVDLETIEVPPQRFDEALKSIPTELADALRTAAARIEAFHRASMPSSWHDEKQGYGERVVALDRAGIYVPGGTATYPSAVLMDAIPACVASVGEIVVCTPSPSDAVLAAASIAGVHRLFQVGGAQAIAAMAYGTESLPRVDKVCGAGGAYVTAAKREVYGDVDIDGLYGPTETLVIADASADPALAAADLLAQAEHDTAAMPILIALDAATAQAIVDEVERQMPSLERSGIASAAMGGQGVAVVVNSMGEAVELANAFAPEHVCLLVEDAERYVDGIRHAGGVFVGEASPEVMGDYVAGPSHTMPTAGTARYASYLGVQHFLRRMPVVALDESRLRELGPAAAAIARAEGLTAHARAIEQRLEGGAEGSGS